MSQDPFFERESAKYAAPIPSREFILQVLSKRKTPATKQELAQELSLKSEEQQEALRRRLRAMENDGQLVFTRKQCYVLPERLNLLKGEVIGHRDGYGFLRVEGYKDDFYIPIEQMKLTVHGDIVLAQPLGMDRRKRYEARIVRVLIAKETNIVGRYFKEAGMGFVVPDDSRLSFDILIPQEETQRARMGSIVVVELIQRPGRRSKAIGKIIEVLGDQMGTGMVIDIALRKHEIPYIWPQEVEKQIVGLEEHVSDADKKGRVDIRNLPLVTIDGEDARDFDDAVYAEKTPEGGWRLWVAIADVSYYVRPRSSLDREAYNRGNSVYFPAKVIPMLPEILSNGLCSLNPQVDRLCMVCEMTISRKGKLTDAKFYEGVMCSHARLTYTKVARILQQDKDLCQRYQPLVPHLNELYRLYQQLDKAREIRGGIAFETEEAKFIFNAERRIERIEPVKRNDAHKIIEECMILANIAAAHFVAQAHEPAIYRVHDQPSDDNISSLRSVLSELGLTLGGREAPKPKDYAMLLEQIAERADHEMLQTMLLRSMKQAIYDPDNRGHFGLALQAYAHFTSPIRRYPDLTLHRSIKYLLAKQHHSPSQHTLTARGGWHSSIDEMSQLGIHCSMTERRADEATRDVADWLKCDFMRDHVGKHFMGTISGVSTFGFFVRLDDLFIDGLVHVSTLDNDYYRYDGVGKRLIGEASGFTYRLGDKVEVRVEAVNMEDRKIDLGLVASQRKPKRRGKTAREVIKKNRKDHIEPKKKTQIKQADNTLKKSSKEKRTKGVQVTKRVRTQKSSKRLRHESE